MQAERDDRQEIDGLLARYCNFLDRGDHDAWLDLFESEGRFEVYGTAFQGSEGLRKMAEAAPGGLHLTGDALVDIEGDTATVKQSFLFVDQSTREIRIGWYDDVLAKTAGGWRFAVRRSTFLTHDGPSERPTSRRSLQDVHNTLARYDALLDGRDLEAWLDLFLDDAVLVVDDRRFETSDARRELVVSSPRGRHQTNLPVLSGNLESGRVHASSSFFFWGLDGSFVETGSYEDELVYRKGAWRFAERSIDLTDASGVE
jgi:3-phenylpropionate/cinnamic acid dioxygenase small subunit